MKKSHTHNSTTKRGPQNRTDGEEKGQAGCHLVHIQAGRLGSPDVLDAVRQREGQLQLGVRTSLLHVVSTDGDAVELWHVIAGVGEDALDDAHRRRGWVDVGVSHHVLLQNVVLDRAGELGLLDALLLGGYDEEGQHGQHSTVHGHRHRDLVQRDAAEQCFHVLNSGDGYASHADIAHHARVVGVVAAVGGKVEGNGESLLTSGQVLAQVDLVIQLKEAQKHNISTLVKTMETDLLVESVRLLCSAEASVLSDGPRLGCIHRSIWSSGIRIDARQLAFPVRVDGLQLDSLGGHLFEIMGTLGAAELLGDQLGPSRIVLSTETCGLLILQAPSLQQFRLRATLHTEFRTSCVHAYLHDGDLDNCGSINRVQASEGVQAVNEAFIAHLAEVRILRLLVNTIRCYCTQNGLKHKHNQTIYNIQ